MRTTRRSTRERARRDPSLVEPHHDAGPKQRDNQCSAPRLRQHRESHTRGLCVRSPQRKPPTHCEAVTTRPWICSRPNVTLGRRPADRRKAAFDSSPRPLFIYRSFSYPAAHVHFRKPAIDGPVLVEPVVHGDDRGFFVETFRKTELVELGLPEGAEFVQENHSRSRRGVVRGMHTQLGPGMAKLVRCARGAIVDVIVDVRRGSPTHGSWVAFELTDANHHQLLVPVGFAHGFCVTSEVADVIYKQTAYYDPELERGIAYDDPDVGIIWPILPEEMIVSERDANAPLLLDIASQLDFR